MGESQFAEIDGGVTTHLRNQILAAVGHARAVHEGPLAVENAIAEAVVRTVEEHANCTNCHAKRRTPLNDRHTFWLWLTGRWGR